MVKKVGLEKVKYRFKPATEDGRGWPGDVKEMLLDIGRLKRLGWKLFRCCHAWLASVMQTWRSGGRGFALGFYGFGSGVGGRYALMLFMGWFWFKYFEGLVPCGRITRVAGGLGLLRRLGKVPAAWFMKTFRKI